MCCYTRCCISVYISYDSHKLRVVVPFDVILIHSDSFIVKTAKAVKAMGALIPMPPTALWDLILARCWKILTCIRAVAVGLSAM